MSGLLFLSDDDFFISKGTKGPILCTNIPGCSLLLFYSTKCPHSRALEPIFRALPGTIQGCQFGMLNVKNNSTCVQLSRSSLTPITYVPHIILYFNGRPYMIYKGPHDMDSIRRFIFEVTPRLQSKHKFASENVKEDPRGRVPEYTIGHPLYGDDETNKTYLEFKVAYKK